MHRRLGTESPRDDRQPFGDRSWLIVGDLVDASCAALRGNDRGFGSVLDVHERPDACAVADDGQLARANRLKHLASRFHPGARTVQPGVAQHHAFGPVRLERCSLDVANGIERLTHLWNGVRVERLVLTLHRCTRSGERPAGERLGDEALDTDRTTGGQEMVRALGAQPVRHRERGGEVTHVDVAKVGQLVDDDLRFEGGDCGCHLLGIEPVGEERCRALAAELVELGRRSGRAGDVMASCHEPWNELAADGAGGACNENLHRVCPPCRTAC